VNPWLIAPLVACLVRVVLDLRASRRLHRWPWAEAAAAPLPEVDEFAVACMAAEREGQALADLMRRRRLVP